MRILLNSKLELHVRVYNCAVCHVWWCTMSSKQGGKSSWNKIVSKY